MTRLWNTFRPCLVFQVKNQNRLECSRYLSSRSCLLMVVQTGTPKQMPVTLPLQERNLHTASKWHMTACCHWVAPPPLHNPGIHNQLSEQRIPSSQDPLWGFFEQDAAVHHSQGSKHPIHHVAAWCKKQHNSLAKGKSDLNSQSSTRSVTLSCQQ